MDVLITIDTEEEWDWSGAFAVDAPSVQNISHLPKFQALCEQFGLHPTYFTNHAVLSDPAARHVMTDLSQRENTEIGMHIHPWNTPPLATRDQPSSAETYLHNLPEPLIRAKLDASHQALVDIGVHATSFRGGRYSSDALIRSHLQSLGYRADSSIVPFTAWPDEGSPDYRTAGLAPTRVQPGNNSQPALWQIPLTRGFTRQPFDRWARWFNRIEQSSTLSRLRLIGIAERLGWVRRFWLNFEIDDPFGWIEPITLLRDMGVPYICFCVHSSSLVAGPGPYTQNATEQQRIESRIRDVFQWLSKQPDMVPATVSSLAKKLEHEFEDHRYQPAR